MYEHNASYSFFLQKNQLFSSKKMAAYTFEGLLPRINCHPEHAPLHRMNASTTYKKLFPYAILASDWTTHMFYLFLTLDEGWVQVPLETGLKLLQHLV